MSIQQTQDTKQAVHAEWKTNWTPLQEYMMPQHREPHWSTGLNYRAAKQFPQVATVMRLDQYDHGGRQSESHDFYSGGTGTCIV